MKHFFKFFPNYSSFANANETLMIGDKVLIRSFRMRATKRLIDIAFSSIIIIFVLSWLIPIVALFIWLDSKGPIFFLQNRTGRNNKVFKIIKFRTMWVMEKDSEFKQATKRDHRVTRVGRFLRKTNLDEMPQFFNVLIGEMSISGPRPHPVKLDEAYNTTIKNYTMRHIVKPGISGWAQVSGFRGETETEEQMRKRIEHDIWYIENLSTRLDMHIIFKTVTNALKKEEMAY